jgi:hypothetical protein
MNLCRFLSLPHQYPWKGRTRRPPSHPSTIRNICSEGGGRGGRIHFSNQPPSSHSFWIYGVDFVCVRRRERPPPFKILPSRRLNEGSCESIRLISSKSPLDPSISSLQSQFKSQNIILNFKQIYLYLIQ